LWSFNASAYATSAEWSGKIHTERAYGVYGQTFSAHGTQPVSTEPSGCCCCAETETNRLDPHTIPDGLRVLFLNPAFNPQYTIEAPSRRALAFHKRLPQYRATPLHALDLLAQALGVQKVWLKDESDRLGLPAFKILGASWATYCALRDRFPELNDEWEGVEELAKRLHAYKLPALYAATDGNHGRAVAHVAAMLGLRARIYVPQGTARARITAIEREGASVEEVKGTYDDTVSKAARDADEHHGLLIQDNGWSGYETIPRYVIEGYSTMLWEIDDELAARGEALPTHVFVQIGVGSFADAVVRHWSQKLPRAIIIGVEPEGAACALESVRAGKIVRVPGPHTSIMAGMNCDSPSSVSFPILQEGVQWFMTIDNDRAIEAMRLLAGLGIVSGETGAAGLGALLELAAASSHHARLEMGLDQRSRVLLFSTEGATNPEFYRSVISGESINKY
jgi:diaminopropionate ammonia-lyase